MQMINFVRWVKTMIRIDESLSDDISYFYINGNIWDKVCDYLLENIGMHFKNVSKNVDSNMYEIQDFLLEM